MTYVPPTPDSAKSSDWSLFGKTAGGSLYLPGGARIAPPTPADLWLDAPAPAEMDPLRFYTHFDDFMYPASATASDVQAYVTIDDSGTGTNAFQDVAGGVYNVVTAASDNDYHAMRSFNKVFTLAADKKLWFEARFKLAEATTDGTATVSQITPYFHNGTAWTAGTAMPVTLSGMTAMYVIWGVKAGPTAAAETLQTDYIKCVQLR